MALRASLKASAAVKENKNNGESGTPVCSYKAAESHLATAVWVYRKYTNYKQHHLTSFLCCLIETFYLIEWKKENKISVHADSELKVGSEKEKGTICEVKFGAKWYSGIILHKGTYTAYK